MDFRNSSKMDPVLKAIERACDMSIVAAVG